MRASASSVSSAVSSATYPVSSMISFIRLSILICGSLLRSIWIKFTKGLSFAAALPSVAISSAFFKAS